MQIETKNRYSPVAQSLHWLSALFVGVAWTLGLLGDELPKGPQREMGEFVHIVTGELVIALLFLRLIWRFVDPPPAAEATAMGRWGDLAAKLAHVALYLLLLTVPIIGIVTLFAGGESLSVFGLFEIASPWPKDRNFKHFMEEIHEVTAHGLIALVGLHAVAAIIHHHVFKDRTLKRMLPNAMMGE